MKNTISIILLSLLLLQSTGLVYADSQTNIDVSGNGPGADSSVNVDTKNSYSSVQTSNENSSTTIHVDSNGQVYDYNSINAGNGNVDYQSNDGSIKVKVSNNGNAGITISPFPTLTTPPLPSIPQITIPRLPTNIAPTITAIDQKIKTRIEKAKTKIMDEKSKINSFLQSLETVLKDLLPFNF